MAEGIVTVNVGGTLYSTYLSVVRKYEQSHLRAMFPEDTSSQKTDKDGNIFIDRDGNTFRFILNFLRDGELILPSRYAEFDLLLKEADFYGLDEMKAEIIKLDSSKKHVVVLTEGKEPFSKASYTTKIAVVVEGTRRISTELQESFKHGFYGAERENPRTGLAKSYFNVNFRGSISIFLVKKGFRQEMTSPLVFAVDI